MAAMQSLDATVRTDSGTGATRALRRDGKVPGVLYGGNGETVGIALDWRELNRVLGVPGVILQTISLTVDGKTERVRLKDVQLHPVSDKTLHVDFMRTGR